MIILQTISNRVVSGFNEFCYFLTIDRRMTITDKAVQRYNNIQRSLTKFDISLDSWKQLADELKNTSKQDKNKDRKQNEKAKHERIKKYCLFTFFLIGSLMI